MKLANPWQCDHCSNVKGENDDWWIRTPNFDYGRESKVFALIAWDEDEADQLGVEHICGNVCAGPRAGSVARKTSGEIMREPAAWTNQWLRELPWRTVVKWNSTIVTLGIPTKGLLHSRFLRLQKEYARRKREGGGGLAAQMDRIAKIHAKTSGN